MEHIVFLTGHLARPALDRVLNGIEQAPFTWEVRDLGLQVAALMTAEMVARRVPAPVQADRILVPGRCRGDLDALTQHYGIPVQRGPEELKDLPRFFNRAAQPMDLSAYEVAIFAEIVERRACRSKASSHVRGTQGHGCRLIDRGLRPPFDHLPESVKAIKAEGSR